MNFRMLFYSLWLNIDEAFGSTGLLPNVGETSVV